MNTLKTKDLRMPQGNINLIIQVLDSDTLARKFHEKYETLAPKFGYETRKESSKPWEEVPENNKLLMRAVCEEILQFLCDAESVERGGV